MVIGRSFFLLALLLALAIASVFIVPNDFHDADCCFETNDSIFSIMTFNVDACDSLRFLPEKQRRLQELISRENPSILCLQELPFRNHEKLRPYLDSVYGKCETLSYADNKWRFQFYSRFPIRNFRKLSSDNILDTTGFDEKLMKEYRTIRKQMPVMSAEFEVAPNRWITLYSGHMRSSAYSTARRSMDEDASWIEGVPLYYRNYDNGKRIRDYEARCIRRYVEVDLKKDMPVIVAGDLNDWCGSDCLNMLMFGTDGAEGPELTDAWNDKGRGWGFTYFGWHLRLTLDHILYSKDFELLDVKVVDTDLSDHKPLMAIFKVK